MGYDQVSHRVGELAFLKVGNASIRVMCDVPAVIHVRHTLHSDSVHLPLLCLRCVNLFRCVCVLRSQLRVTG